MPRFLIAICLSVVGVSAQAADLRPDDFAYGMRLTTQGASVAYRVTIPVDVYSHTSRRNLGDLRVFNANDEVVPHELRRPAELTEVVQAAVDLPLFALQGDPQRAIDSLRVTIVAGDRDVSVLTTGAPAGETAIASYIVNSKALPGPIEAFILGWRESQVQYAGEMSVEASDDLSNWRRVALGSIANLRAGSESLVENEIRIPATNSRYYRLSWIDRPPPFTLIRLQARAARTQLAQPRELYVADGLAVPGAAGEFDFRLPGNLPVDQFNVALPELNSVARVTLSVSEANAGPWRPIATTSVYRLASGTGETRNTARSVGLIQRPYWRMRVEQPAGVLGKLAPRLQVGWVPHELVFIARGEPPFRLAYGSATVESAEVRLADIVPGLGREIPLAVVIADPEEVLGGPARLVAAAKPFDWRSALLWISLVLGVLLLGWMAFRLMRDMNPPADD